jgi:hypothetical protein
VAPIAISAGSLPDDSAPFGAGAFLLAGDQIAQLAQSP